MVRLQVQNIKGVTNAINKYGKDAEDEIKSVTKITAQEVEETAKSIAQSKKIWDKGTLVQSIQTLGKVADKGFTWVVAALQPYSAYHEFGTGGRVNIPEGWNTMAAQFKGKGIKTVNIQARPFMYPAYIKGRTIFKKNIKDALKHLNKKFNNG